MTFINSNLKWEDLKWSYIEENVFRVQKQIYEATIRNDYYTVRYLQNYIINWFEAKALAVRKVTQISSGKRTPGVDKWMPVSNEDRLAIATQLYLDGNAVPVLRVYIEKPGKSEYRPLGIPTILDRCKQCLVKLSLEPEMEAKADRNSYGFRPGRTAHDAIVKIRSYLAFANSPVWVVDADIKKCFDRIGHEALLSKIPMGQPFDAQLRAWLKAGVLYEGKVFSTYEDTPQGGVISPLLANIALDGIQTVIYNYLLKYFGKNAAEITHFIRYADDIVILTTKLEYAQAAKSTLEWFLSNISLELSDDEKKNRILVTTSSINNSKGKISLRSTSFDFLGFRFIQRYVSKHKELVFKNGFKTRYITNVIPSPKRVERHKASITNLLTKIGDVRTLIDTLNPRITGWCNYFRHSDAKAGRDIPRKMDLWLNMKVRKFIRRTTSKRGKVPEFWLQDQKDWTLYYKDKNGNIITLIKYSSFKWSISNYKSITSGFTIYQLPTLSGFNRKQIEEAKQ